MSAIETELSHHDCLREYSEDILQALECRAAIGVSVAPQAHLLHEWRKQHMGLDACVGNWCQSI